ncbi:hypothetical protein SERLADRAFT_456273 [Serpula lacrymans var. lacrymans S7.9]|uniref:Uncharacterized protein n=1 Tax=Serpula lacrymans var. lacrymans (strain S7.9) TaxID=578457 RepID=F8NI72_SERL9|nr:uncharacterized protein SERLADRAFT_456273 [Serpula lacrymans var. lacrymans S7.9]EGO28969.1 hypothetical protein SERLADRAFT_456273 [Serpula lacrymans var. lacrymans S7.9]
MERYLKCIFYGIYLVTLVQCLFALLWSDSKQAMEPKIRWRLLVVAILLFIIATLDIACSLRFNIVAIVYYTGPGGPAALEGDWLNIMKSVNYVMQTWIGGALLIYRCYLVYEKNWRIIIPASVLWLASCACGIAAGIGIFNSPTLLYGRQIQPYVTSVLSLTVGMNIITASLIAYRMWTIDKQVAKRIHISPTSLRLLRHRQILQIVVESAAFYTLTVVVFICIYSSQSNAYVVAGDSLVQIQHASRYKFEIATEYRE